MLVIEVEEKKETNACYLCKKEYPKNRLSFLDDMAICPMCQSIKGLLYE
jgi:Zn finger protein HypA/HybF involved in hydrogenase expression